MGIYLYRAKLKPHRKPDDLHDAEDVHDVENLECFNRQLTESEKGCFKSISDETIFSISYSSYNAVRSCLSEMFNVGEVYTDMNNPLSLIVSFSDCEGYIGPTATKQMSDFLKTPKARKKILKFIKKFKDDEDVWYENCYAALLLGIIEAGENGEYLIFS